MFQFFFKQAIQSIAMPSNLFKAMSSIPKPTQSKSIPLHSAKCKQSFCDTFSNWSQTDFHLLLVSWYNVPSFPWCKNLVKAILINWHTEGFKEKIYQILWDNFVYSQRVPAFDISYMAEKRRGKKSTPSHIFPTCKIFLHHHPFCRGWTSQHILN